ncbi:MAG: phosphotransferase [Ignavibacteriaceae bacterium]|nr:phosphotransferase [Ignavibacteriaceae bacterium]
MILNKEIITLLENKLKQKVLNITPLSGGCISNAYKLTLNDKQEFFLKYNPSVSDKMFITESHGLQELNKSGAIRVPEVILYDDDFILLELIQQGNKSKNFFSDFGRSFALMHKYSSEKYGFYENNFIGSNEQKNIPLSSEKDNWTSFYFNKRILFQLELAEKLGNATSELKKGIGKLEEKIEEIIRSCDEKPSLLHGDLWGGNYMVAENGNACLIDPAVYYGHREADLGMTKLFGGFSSQFYEAYNETYPLEDGYEYRENIYKLYHVLNHLNLFGGGYYSQAISLIHFYV